ncbi:MAG: glycoside hydrolase family 27 protein [Bacteroidales bacterium]|nr:glycoside hydrolase family 27 protein [Bacteroidales bacterium]
MKRIKTLLTVSLLLMAVQVCFSQRTPDKPLPKWEGLADTPQMGWSSWNKFQTNIHEDLIKDIADKMVEYGLVDAGYVYLNLDDGWHGERDAQGFIHEDPEKFPSGMKALADYLHARGLKLGIYSDAGTNTCACYAGSLGHEYQDAFMYAHWGVDYLKYDWCYTNNINPKGAYALMRNALRAAGRPILFSMCEWGSSKPWEWAADVGHSWRTTGDIGISFMPIPLRRGPDGRPLWKALGVMEIVEMNEPLRQYAGPGHWNDPDMLEVGNGMSVSEDRAHFTLWCMMAAPLILGNDITNMTPETLAIITNREMIAVDQDPLGVQGLRLKKDGDLQYWFKPLSDGDWAFCILNTGDAAVTVPVDWSALEVDDELSGRATSFCSVNYSIRDIWNPAAKTFTTLAKGKGKQRGQLVPVNTQVIVGSHDVAAFRLSPKQ